MICASKRYIDWKLTKQLQIGVSVGRLHHFHEPQISELENNKFSHKNELKKWIIKYQNCDQLSNWWRNHPRSSQVSQGIMTVPCTVWSAGTPGPQRMGRTCWRVCIEVTVKQDKRRKHNTVWENANIFQFLPQREQTMFSLFDSLEPNWSTLGSQKYHDHKRPEETFCWPALTGRSACKGMRECVCVDTVRGPKQVPFFPRCLLMSIMQSQLLLSSCLTV